MIAREGKCHLRAISYVYKSILRGKHEKRRSKTQSHGKKTPKASKNEKFVKPADDDLKLYWKTGNMLYPVPAVMVSCKGKEEGDADNIVTVAWAGTIC